MPRKNDVVRQLVDSRVKAVLAVEPVKLFARIPVNKTIPTGVTMLNLAASGDARGGWEAGKIVHIVGDSDTGKSALAYTTLAECAPRPRFSKYAFYKDDVERSDSFPVEDMFGRALVKRLLAPHVKDGEREASEFIEEFYFGMYALCKKGDPFLYVLDTMCALEGVANLEKFEENAALYAKGRELKGSYGDGKAKYNSDNLRKIKNALNTTSSALLILSQTRDNIDPMTMAEKTHAAGKALKYYSHYQMWLAARGKLTKSISGKQQEIGTLARVKLSKNHATGKHLDFVMPMYYGYGIDDEQCTLRWITSPDAGNVWKMSKGVLTTREECGLRKTYNLSDFVRGVRNGELREQYLDAVQLAWDEMEAQLRRPGRYSGRTDEASEGDFE